MLANKDEEAGTFFDVIIRKRSCMLMSNLDLKSISKETSFDRLTSIRDLVVSVISNSEHSVRIFPRSIVAAASVKATFRPMSRPISLVVRNRRRLQHPTKSLHLPRN